MRDCSRRHMVNAFCNIQWDEPKQSARGKESVEEAPKESEEEDCEDEGENLRAFPRWCNTLSKLGPKHAKMPPRGMRTSPALVEETRKYTSNTSTKGKRLMFIDVKLNGKPIRAMVDMGAIHNYVASSEVENMD